MKIPKRQQGWQGNKKNKTNNLQLNCSIYSQMCTDVSILMDGGGVGGWYLKTEQL